MTVDQILKKAKTPKRQHWDMKTVQDALAVREELVPKLLEHMNWYYEQAQNPDWEPDEDASFLTYNGCHLLGEMKETKLYPILLKLLALPEPMLDCTFGDDLTEDLKDILAATYDGSLEETEALVRNEQAYEYARSTTLQAMGRICKAGGISREELARFIREVLKCHVTAERLSKWTGDNPEYPGDDTILSAVRDTVELVQLHEVCLDLRDLVRSGAMFDDDYADCLDRIFNWPGAPREEWCPPELNEDGDADDDADDDADGPTAQEKEILAYNCGRNDPCPCGSGKKFKKCHLWVQEDLKAKYANRKPKPKSQPKLKSIYEQLSAPDPIIFPPIENVGDKPGLAAYYPREAIEADVHIYRGMKIDNDRPLGYEFKESETRLAIEELWKGFEIFEKICQEKGYTSYNEYDRNCLVHYTAKRWLHILYYDLKKQGDSRMKAVEKWIQ